MSRKVAFSPWLLPLVVFMFAVAAFAQTTASIQGTVTDQSGAAVVGAKVIVKSPASGIERTTQTSSTGAFEVPALPPGVYSVQVQMTGFETQLAKDVILEVSKNSVQNFNVKVASTSEVVTVESTAPVVEATTMTVGQTINQRTVQDIPLNGRHFVDLALLIPGTVTPPQSGFLTAPLRGQGSFAFNTAGNREDAVNFMINGINLNDMLQNQVTFQPTINTVSEFKVDNSTYSAESGRNSGAIVNIATRSGADQFHGEVYDYLRNNWFDARNAFNPKLSSTGAPIAQSPFKRNQFGGDFGGPIIKGKTFFFLSYEGLRHRQGLNTASNVLSDTDRNTIQAGSNAVAKALLPFIPQANATIGGSPAFLGSATAPVDIDQGTADINHNFSDADRLHGYYVYQRDLRQEATAGTSITGFGDTRDGHRQVFTLGETHVFSPNVVNEVRLGANRIHLTFSPNNTTLASAVGINMGPNPTFMPTIRIQGTGFGTNLQFGTERNFPQGRGDLTAAFGDTLSYLRGRHSLKFGTEFRDFRNNNFNDDPGQIFFNGSAAFINGVVLSFQRNPGNIASRINQNALDFFAQDSWKLSSSLTLELGLRYAWNMTPAEGANRFVSFIPVAGTTTAQLMSTGTPYAQNNKNFQPRLGFSWDVFHKGNTILRGGYAYQVDQPITGYVTGLASNPPFGALINVPSGAPSVAAVGVALNGPPASISPTSIDPNFKNANIQSWNLNIQQQVGRNAAIMVGYFGTKGTHLGIDRNINQPINPALAFANPNLLSNRPFQTLANTVGAIPAGTTLSTTILEHDSSSNSNYHALWITANKRMSHGLQFNASYTWSHSIDDNSRNAEGISLQDSNNLLAERANSDFDTRHRFVVNAIYDLPFRSSSRLIGGWQVATIASLQSGNPFTVNDGGAGASNLNGGALLGNVTTVRPDIVGPVTVTNNPSGWLTLAPGALVNPTNHFGNLGRNAFVGPGWEDIDFSVIKNTKLTEKLNVQFRADAFDMLNHPNFGQPTANPGTAAGALFTGGTTFAAISSTRFPAGDSGSSRQLQFALKLQF
jgi:hypothetical protein